MDVLFVDNHLFVVSKPPDLLTQKTQYQDLSLEKLAKAWIKIHFQKPGDVYLHPIHRLDKPVSGVVVFARTSKALSRLQKSIREKKVEKKYLALVFGLMKEKKGILEHRLVHGDRQAYEAKEGKLSVLSYQVLGEFQKSSLLLITLETGRYHQIRCQLSLIGHPILGDQLYGDKESWRGKGIALHHVQFSLIHPVLMDKRVFFSPPPVFGWEEWCEGAFLEPQILKSLVQLQAKERQCLGEKLSSRL